MVVWHESIDTLVTDEERMKKKKRGRRSGRRMPMVSIYRPQLTKKMVKNIKQRTKRMQVFLLKPKLDGM